MGIFPHRASRILKDRLSNAAVDHETWDLRPTQLRFDRGGHVARLQHLDPTRLTFRVFLHSNYEGIVTGIEAHNRGRQCHNRHLHVWRWEYYMYKYIGKKIGPPWSQIGTRGTVKSSGENMPLPKVTGAYSRAPCELLRLLGAHAPLLLLHVQHGEFRFFSVCGFVFEFILFNLLPN